MENLQILDHADIHELMKLLLIKKRIKCLFSHHKVNKTLKSNLKLYIFSPVGILIYKGINENKIDAKIASRSFPH